MCDRQLRPERQRALQRRPTIHRRVARSEKGGLSEMIQRQLLEHSHKQGFLVLVIAIEGLFGDVGSQRDRIHTGAGKAVAQKEILGSHMNSVAFGLGARSGGSRVHLLGSFSTILYSLV